MGDKNANAERFPLNLDTGTETLLKQLPDVALHVFSEGWVHFTKLQDAFGEYINTNRNDMA